MEDADPLEVEAARIVVRGLDAVDRVTHFRAIHNAEFRVEQGERRPIPRPRPTPRPELAGLDPFRLAPAHRARLRHRYRQWEGVLRRAGLEPLHANSPDGGTPLPRDLQQEAAARFDEWRAVVDEASTRG